MKKSFISVVLNFTFLIVLNCQSSIFQPGAIWIGTHDGPCGIGYDVCEYIGDTIIREHTISIVEKKSLIFSYLESDFYEFSAGKRYYVKIDDKLYLPTGGFFKSDTLEKHKKLIFDFSAEEGDTIKHYIHVNRRTKKKSLRRYTVIDSIKIEILNDIPHKTWYGEFSPADAPKMSNTVIFNERIGELTMYPFTKSQQTVNREVQDLIYYSDNTGFKYDPFDEYNSYLLIKEKCSSKKDKVNISESLIFDEIFIEKLYPNPADDNLFLKIIESSDLTFMEYEIHKPACKNMISRGKISNYLEKIDISDIPNGIFVFILKNKGRFQEVRQFVVMK